MIYNRSAHVLQYCNDTNWIAAGPAYYVGHAVTFDGSNDHIRLTGSTLGGTDGKTVTGSFWIRRSAATGAQNFVFHSYSAINNYFYIEITAGDLLHIQAANTATVLNVTSVAAINRDSNWHHVVFSFDMANAASRHIMIDGVASGLTVTTYSNADIDFTHNSNTVGATNLGLFRLNADISEFWLETGVYMDLTVAANMAKFRDSYARPENVGATGAVPTGSAPDVFLGGILSGWHTNKGSGGGFTVTGALTTPTSNPSDTALGAGCSSPTGAEGEYFYNTDHNVMQYCNGLGWIAMGPIMSAGGSACTSPAGAIGSMIYNSTNTTMQYCNGTNWVRVGN